MPQESGALPECTFFTHSHPNALEDFLYDFHVDFPEVVSDKTKFMSKMRSAQL
jgi:hypothetical protein